MEKNTQTIIVVVLVFIIIIGLALIFINFFIKPTTTGNIVNQNELKTTNDCVNFLFSCIKYCPEFNNKINDVCMNSCVESIQLECEGLIEENNRKDLNQKNIIKLSCMSGCQESYSCVQKCLK